MKSLLDKGTYNEIIDRITLLNDDSVPEWGKMNVSQMLAHCQGPLKIALDKMTLKKPNVFICSIAKLFRHKLYDDKLWSHGIPTAKEFLVNDKRDFIQEKETLKILIEEFYEKGIENEWLAHPIFGKFTTEQWGKMQYKHLDHHLRQFNV